MALVLLAAWCGAARAQATDSIFIRAHGAVATIQRECPDTVELGVGAVFECTFRALDAQGQPTRAIFELPPREPSPVFDVTLSPEGEAADSAVAAVTIRQVGAAYLVVRVDPLRVNSAALFPHPGRPNPTTMPPTLFAADDTGHIEIQPTAEARAVMELGTPLDALVCIFAERGGRVVAKSDPLCPGDAPLCGGAYGCTFADLEQQGDPGIFLDFGGAG